MTKERLEELIKNRATIYYLSIFDTNDKEVIEHKPPKSRVYKNLDDGSITIDDIYDKYWFESREDVEWHKEFGCIERVERLELPTWEEIENTINHFCYFTDCYGRECCLSYKRATNKVKLKYWVDVGDAEEEFECGEWEFTKENYILACRKCKELFLGEENNV